MIGISLSELALIFILCLVFIKPQEWPNVFYNLGCFTNKIKSIIQKFNNEWQESFNKNAFLKENNREKHD